MADLTVPEVIEKYKQWELGGGQFKGPQPVMPLAEFQEGSDRLYNLKSLEEVRYLQWEDWDGPTVNLGYTDNANAETAKKVARWFFARSGGGAGPITYGESVAIGYGIKPSFYRYKRRTFGVNIANEGGPSFEWRFLGGPAGQPVGTGERLAIYNDTGNEALIVFDQDFGVSLGWPSSERILNKIPGWIRDVAVEALKELLKESVKVQNQ
jgi:hypothetical protein